MGFIPQSLVLMCLGLPLFWKSHPSMCDFVPCDRIMQRAYLALNAHRVHMYCLKPWLSSISFNTKLLSEMEQHYLGFLFGAENFMDLIDLVFSLAPSWCVSESSLGAASRLLAIQ